MFSFIIPRGRGGIGEVIKVALPLVVASLGHAVNLFTDRVMLASYSPQTMAAAFPAGLTAFTFSCIFLGIVGYCGVFVAQYTGAGKPGKAALAVWQGIWGALAGGAVLAGTSFFAADIFALFGHEAHLQPLEVIYFEILSWFGFIPLITAALAGFWGGRAKTGIIMLANLLITGVNLPLNYLFIFGNSFTVGSYTFTIPEMGIVGAAWGTVGAGAVGMLLYTVLFFSRSNREKFGTARRMFSWRLLGKLIRFGYPTGIQLVLELATFNIFIVLLGKISADVLLASGVVFSAYSFAFNPMIGFAQTASILVGQGVGAKDIAFAEKCVRSIRFWLFCYSMAMIVAFVCFPERLFELFNLPQGEVRDLTHLMLIFTVFYLIFDAMNVLYSNAVKGAGDTFFVMIVGILLGWLGYALPCIGAYAFFVSDYAVNLLGSSAAQSWCLWSLWGICDLYIILLGVIFYAHYRRGKWKSMSVI